MSKLTQNYDRFLIGGPLKDTDIHRYARLGFYGPKKQALALSAQPRVKSARQRERDLNSILAVYNL